MPFLKDKDNQFFQFLFTVSSSLIILIVLFWNSLNFSYFLCKYTAQEYMQYKAE